MKYSFFANYIFFFSVLLALVSCQGEEYASGNEGMGYLSLEIGASASTPTKADGPAADYDPKKLLVQILDEEGTAVVSTVDWKNEEFRLKAGTYTVKASSNGFDGLASCAQPYYAGSKEVTIVAGKKSTAELTCTLANVKVTVAFDESFLRSFASAAVTVKSVLAGVDPHSYQMGTDEGDYYFPVGDLTADLSVFNKQNVKFEHQEKIEGVKARDYYKLTYKVKEQGQGSITVNADGSEQEFVFDFKVSTDPSAVVNVKTVNAWSSFARLEGNAKDVKGNPISASFLTFEYREESSENWTAVTADIATDAEGNHSVILKGLIPEKKYMYRLVYKNDGEEVGSSESSFTTEAQSILPGGSFDEWSQNGKIVFPGTQAEADAKNSYWDTGNVGASTMSKNPTVGEDSDVHTQGGQSAKMVSQFVGMLGVGKFAAGNIYTGHYCDTYTSPMGARIRFGRPFASRPTQLKGWYKYTRATTVDRGEESDYKQELVNSGGDKCAIYIALVDNEGLKDENFGDTAFEINNSLSADNADKVHFKNTIDFSEANPHIIAYGTLLDAKTMGTNGWEEFAIDLVYRDLNRKPKYIIVVASASKYGDYFTGGSNSTLLIDDFELIYGDSPKLLGSDN